MILLAAEGVSDINLNTIILAIISGVSGIVIALITGASAVFLAKINRKATATQETAQVVAVKVDEVKQDLAISNTHTNEQLNDIHTLVNSNYGVQLKISAIALRKVANYSNEQDDIMAAELAETALSEHQTKQRAVDADIKERKDEV